MTSETETECCGGPQRGATKGEASSSALDILAERFARGEIGKAEFDEKRQIIAELRKDSPSAGASRKGCC